MAGDADVTTEPAYGAEATRAASSYASSPAPHTESATAQATQAPAIEPSGYKVSPVTKQLSQHITGGDTKAQHISKKTPHITEKPPRTKAQSSKASTKNKAIPETTAPQANGRALINYQDGKQFAFGYRNTDGTYDKVKGGFKTLEQADKSRKASLLSAKGAPAKTESTATKPPEKPAESGKPLIYFDGEHYAWGYKNPDGITYNKIKGGFPDLEKAIDWHKSRHENGSKNPPAAPAPDTAPAPASPAPAPAPAPAGKSAKQPAVSEPQTKPSPKARPAKGKAVRQKPETTPKPAPKPAPQTKQTSQPTASSKAKYLSALKKALKNNGAKRLVAGHFTDKASAKESDLYKVAQHAELNPKVVGAGKHYMTELDNPHLKPDPAVKEIKEVKESKPAEPKPETSKPAKPQLATPETSKPQTGQQKPASKASHKTELNIEEVARHEKERKEKNAVIADINELFMLFNYRKKDAENISKTKTLLNNVIARTADYGAELKTALENNADRKTIESILNKIQQRTEAEKTASLNTFYRAGSPAKPKPEPSAQTQPVLTKYAARLAESKTPDQISGMKAHNAFPEPDYEKLAKEGVPHDVLGAVNELRDKVNTNYTHPNSVRAWAYNVITNRKIAHDLLTGKKTVKQFIKERSARGAGGFSGGIAKGMDDSEFRNMVYKISMMRELPAELLPAASHYHIRDSVATNLPGYEFYRGTGKEILHHDDLLTLNKMIKDYLSKEHKPKTEPAAQTKAPEQLNIFYSKQADKPRHLDINTVHDIAKDFVDRYKGNLNLNVRVYRTQEAAYGDWYNQYKLYGSYDADAQKAVKTKTGADGKPFKTPEIEQTSISERGVPTPDNARSYITDGNNGRNITNTDSSSGNQTADKNSVRGLVRLNAAAFEKAAEVETTLRHEILGHYGLNTFSRPDKLAILDAISKAENNPDYAELWGTVKKRYPDLEKHKLAQAEEVFAHAAQLEKSQRTARTGKRLIPSSVMHAFHQALRKSGLVRGKMSIKELYDAIDATADGIKAGTRPQVHFPKKNGYEFGRYTQQHGRALISDTGHSSGTHQGVSLKHAQGIASSMMKDVGDTGLKVKVVKTQAEAEALAGAKTGDRVHAMYLPESKTIVLVADNLKAGTIREKMRHELIHHALEHLITRDEYNSLLKMINDTRSSGNKEIQKVWKLVEKNYDGAGKDIQALEFLAHMSEQHQPGKFGIRWERFVNAVKKLLHKAGLITNTTFNDLHQVKETLHTLSQRLRQGYEPSETTVKGNTAVAHAKEAKPDPFKAPQEEADKYRAELAKAMKSHRSADITVTVSHTPPVLRSLGAPELPLTISRDTIRKATNGVKHVVPMDVIERLPELLHDPEAVYRSATQDNGMLVLLNAKDKNGDPVVSALHLKTNRGGIEINRIASVYGAFPGKLTKAEREGLALYKKVDPDVAGVLQLHGGALHQGHASKILYPDDIRKGVFYSKEHSSETDDNFHPKESRILSVIKNLQDKYRIVKEIQDRIIKRGGTVNEASDAYLAEELSHGKAENDLTNVQNRYIKPLSKLLVDYNITREQLDEYLYARHAPERNAYIASINKEMPEGGSGMTDAEAKQIIDKVKASGKQPQYDRLAGIIDDMLTDRRELLKIAGLEEEDITQAWQKTYKHYVPLKTAERGSAISKRALGRSSRADSPVIHTIQDLTATIKAVRKNEVGNALLRLVSNNLKIVKTPADTEALAGVKTGGRLHAL